jgi:signal transduction histidine kinase
VLPVVQILNASSTTEGVHQITVWDNGIGFEQKYKDIIFQPFQRLHSASEYQGSGIGLAICQKIIQRHHGKITVQNKPGEGSTFTVTRPIQQTT